MISKQNCFKVLVCWFELVCTLLFLGFFLTSCRSVVMKATSSTKGVYDSDSYLLKAVLKDSDKIAFEVCTVNRRFLKQNQVRTTGCIPAYLTSTGKEVIFTVKDLITTFSAEELAVAEQIVAKINRQRQKVRNNTGVILLSITGSAAGSGGVTYLAFFAPPVFLGVVLGLLGGTVLYAALEEQRKSLDSAQNATITLSSEQKEEAIAEIATTLNMKKENLTEESLAEMAHHWNSIMTLDPKKVVEITSVIEAQKVLGWYLNQALSTKKLALFCHPVIHASHYGRDSKECLNIVEPTVMPASDL
ncbi:MAG: hypothetical protein OXC40_06535 [Proteobacteria bacterium]|nr:hypothetical protein [Pseudomonadota bacterium]